jgi:hypothetical protein
MTAPALDLSAVILKHGGHNAPDDGMCLLEAVSWFAGEPFSDHPACVCPTLGAFGRAWNDGLPDDESRTRLLGPLIPRLVGTNLGPVVSARRSWMALDWLIRVHQVAWLRLAGLTEHADALASMPEIRTVADLSTTGAARDAARDAAWAAAGAAAWPAAGAAARDAAGAAARDAAWAAAGAAAGDAAWDAAWDAAGDAAWDAARDAAWDAARAAAWAAAALAPTVAELQASALGLIDRMLAVTA